MPVGDRRCANQARRCGYALLGALLVLALVSLGLAVAGPIWSQQAQRDREQELLRIGLLYAQALASYRQASPGSTKQYPDTLDALLLDTRFVGTRRHLRKLYQDPINPGKPWGRVHDADGRITGVYSLSQAAPLAERPIQFGNSALPADAKYSDWKFVATPPP